MYQHQTGATANTSQCSVFGCLNAVNGKRHCEKHTAKRSQRRFFIKSRPTPIIVDAENNPVESRSQEHIGLADVAGPTNFKSVLQENGHYDASAARQLAPAGDQTATSPADRLRTNVPLRARDATQEAGLATTLREVATVKDSSDSSQVFETPSTKDIDTQQQGGSSVPRAHSHGQALLSSFHDLQTPISEEKLPENRYKESMTLDNEFTKVILAGNDKDTAIRISSDSETDSVNYTYAHGKEPEFHEVDEAIDTDDGRSTQVSEQVDQPEVNGFLDGDNTETTVTVPRSSSANDDTHTVPAEPSSTDTATWLKSSFATKETEISIVNKPSTVGTAIIQRHQTVAHKRNFDSDAFDEMIYRQFQSKRGKARHQPTAVDSTDLGERLYLPVNPAIHRPHNRSKEWRDDKMKDIKKRGNRKKWFGKAAERLRWLYEKEQTEQAQRHAQTNQTNMAASKRRDPQPRTNTRAVDFGDVREEALPEDVRSNPAWAKAAAWHREIHTENLEKAHSMSRKRRLTWRQYTVLEQEAAKKWQEG